ETQRNDFELFGRANFVDIGQFMFLSLAKHNDLAGSFGQVSLYFQKYTGFYRIEIRVEYVPMKGVDYNRYSAVQCGKPSNRTGFCGMCMDNIRFKFLDNFPEFV